MKGLLLKDFYLITKYCRAFLIVIVLFAILSAFNNDMFMLYYPCIIVGMMPMTLQTYDEREKWCSYSLTMPYTRAQMVSAKYLIGLIFNIVFVIFISIAQLFRFSHEMNELFNIILSISAVSLLSPAVTLPFIFKFGTEKGRIMYYIVIGISCALVGIVGSKNTITSISSMPVANDFPIMPVLAIAAVILYAVSWLLSIKFYQKREI